MFLLEISHPTLEYWDWQVCLTRNTKWPKWQAECQWQGSSSVNKEYDFPPSQICSLFFIKRYFRFYSYKDLIKTFQVMFRGNIPLKLGDFKNFKPNFKQYSRTNGLKITKNPPKVWNILKYIKNKTNWMVELGMPMKIWNVWGKRGAVWKV